jgi:ParB family chromosome partitioning protein
MKIDISKIDEGRFAIREEINQEHINQIAKSLLEDGQWNPIIVRPVEGGRYEIIAGHYRLQASKEAGFLEIEATIKDLSDEEADLLSLKTNLLRLEMSAREQGRVLSQMMESYGLSQRELAKRLNVDPSWISRRIRVALSLHEEVGIALDERKINMNVAAIISGVVISRQPELLEIMTERGVTQSPEASKTKQLFLNDTIFTIGFQDRSIEDFIDILKRNRIRLLVDARYSAESQLKPEFDGNVLRRELERNNVKYVHHSKLGVPPVVLNPYKEGALKYNCLKQWYEWHINAETNFEELMTYFKRSGKVVLMCTERYAKPKRNQQYACHRDILADLILKHESEDPLIKFEKRIDL